MKAAKWALALTALSAAAKNEGPQDLDELLVLGFPDGDAPAFVPLQSTPQVAVASNDTAILKIMDLTVSALPLTPGYTTFKLHHFLSADLPTKTTIDLVWFKGGSDASHSTSEICPYLEFAKLQCPLKAYKRDEVMKQVLQVPEPLDEGRFSFIAKVITPRGDIVAHIAAIIDLVPGIANDEHDEHDEL